MVFLRVTRSAVSRICVGFSTYVDPLKLHGLPLATALLVLASISLTETRGTHHALRTGSLVS
jgi:hypothetical protein